MFIVLGTLAGVIGQEFAFYKEWISRIGGVFVIVFGLFMLGVIKIPSLQSDKRVPIPSWITIGQPSSSFIIGGIFAFGWTPCVGPILGSILLLASISNTALEGALLLLVFSFGLSLPFLLVAAGFSYATNYINALSKYLRWVSIIGGLFLIFIGLLLVTDNFGLLIQYGFRIFDFLGYDILLNYL